MFKLENGIYFKKQNSIISRMTQIRMIINYAIIIISVILSVITIEYLLTNYEKYQELNYITLFITIFIIIALLLFYNFTYTGSKIDDTITRISNVLIFSIVFTGAVLYVIICSGAILKIIFLISIVLYIFLTATQLTIFKNKRFWLVAVHESAHAIISEIQFPGSVEDITIKKKSKYYSGLTTSNFDNKNIYKLYLGQVKIFLAGKIGENLFLDFCVNQEPIGDIELINKTLKDMVNNNHLPNYKNRKWELLSKIEQRKIYENITNSEYKSVKNTLQENEKVVLEIAKLVMKNKFISGDNIRNIINDYNL